MVDLPFKIITKEYQAHIIYGVQKDTFLDSLNSGGNYGASNFLSVGTGRFAPTVRSYTNTVVELVVPDKKDIPGFDLLIKLELVLTVKTVQFDEFVSGVWEPRPTWWLDLALVEIPDVFDEGSGTGGAGWCNWNERIMSVAWARKPGAISSSFGSYDDGDGFVYDTNRYNLATGIDSESIFKITENLSFGETKRFALFGLKYEGTIGGGVSSNLIVSFHSNQAIAPNLLKKPKLRVTYRDYAVDAFGTRDSALSIEPWEDNREFPLLKWGGVKDVDFVNFKLYRDTQPITTIAGLSPNGVLLATITSPENGEYVDKTIATNGTDDNKTFYYVVIAEDGNNVGDDATFSTNVSFKKPDVALTSVTPAGTSDVGDKITLTVTSNTDVKRLYADWKDGSKVWYEFGTVGPSKTVEHIYSAMVDTTTLGVRVEDDIGFWSSLRPTADSIKIDDVTPIAVLIARPLKIALGEKVYLNASLSHPVASNEVISEYRFWRTVAGWSGWQSAPTLEWTPTIEGLNEAYVEVKTAGGLTAQSSSQEVEVQVIVAELLDFSKDTKITSRAKSRETSVSSTLIQGGSGEVDIRTGLTNPRIALNGITSKAGLKTDLDLLEDAVDTYRLVAVRAFDEDCGAYVYYEGRIVDYSITKTSARLASWSCTMRVSARKPLTSPMG